ncbi:heterokaryon incompatibility protein-domain-containing protein, partial [Cercophora newfieldiana]
MGSSYSYQPLSAASEIRILELDSADAPSAPLHASLAHEPLDQITPYEALSYTWGADVFPHQLHIGPESHTINITSNLHSALQHLRPRTGPPRRLWIDALCINQADPDEKSKQIPLMAAIYRDATKVIAWLG